MKLLTTGNPKVLKSIKHGYLTSILHLAPATLSGYNVCPKASDGCIAACLNLTGRGGIIKKGETTNVIQLARIRKTKMFFEQRGAFLAALVADIERNIKYADKRGLVAVFRLNGTSDISWNKYPVVRDGVIHANIFAAFPNTQFYDYSAVFRTPKNIPNWHITFSRKENNRLDVAMAIANGVNVAVVFDGGLPSEYFNRRVVDGTEHDLRFLDPKGVVIGLVTKGWNANKARARDSGFAVPMPLSRVGHVVPAFCDQRN